MNSGSDPFVRFEKVGEKLAPALREKLLALGPAAVPGLLRFIEDDSHWNLDSPSKGHAPLHAVDLLVELKATEAIEPLLDALCDTEWDGSLHDKLLQELPKLGAPVLEPALARLSDKRRDARVGVCVVLSNLGVRDPRIFGPLCSLMKDDPMQGAICLGDYKDPAALPLLSRAIEDFDVDAHLDPIQLATFVESYEQIAPLPPELRSLVDQKFARFEETAGSPVHRLLNAGEKLAPALRAEILALGSAAIPRLMRIVEEDVAVDSWGASHAVALLIELKAVDAAGLLLDVLCAADFDDALHDDLLLNLPKLGAALVEPGLALLAEDLSTEQRFSVCSALARVGVHDARIYEQLGRLFAEHPFFGAICFGTYGDPAALPLISRAIEQFTANPDGKIELVAYVEAHQKLAPLPPALGTRADELFAAIDALRAPARRPENQVGRNDPCPCGSGLKFKKCHMGKS